MRKIIINLLIILLLTMPVFALEELSKDKTDTITVSCDNSTLRINNTEETFLDVSKGNSYTNTFEYTYTEFLINVTQVDTNELIGNLATNDSVNTICNRIKDGTINEIEQHLTEKLLPDINLTISNIETIAQCKSLNPNNDNVPALTEQIFGCNNRETSLQTELKDKQTTIIWLIILIVILFMMGVALAIMMIVNIFKKKNEGL